LYDTVLYLVRWANDGPSPGPGYLTQETDHAYKTASTVPSRLSRNNYRTTARIVGVMYLAGMVVGIGGNLIIQSILGAPDPLSTIAANSTLLAIGTVLWLSTVAGDAAHGKA
jgi:hypothetical protein